MQVIEIIPPGSKILKKGYKLKKGYYARLESMAFFDEISGVHLPNFPDWVLWNVAYRLVSCFIL